MNIPETANPPLIRTDFSDDAKWRALVAAAQAESPDGFVANVDPVDNRAFNGADALVLATALAAQTDHPIAFVADAEAMTGAHTPILSLDLVDIGQVLRIVPAELWSIENNISIANMDFDEFVGAAGRDGVFLGFD